MERIHQVLNNHKGEHNPLVKIANNLSKTCRVLCFDELFVSDIADAMILAGLSECLFECLFKQGVGRCIKYAYRTFIRKWFRAAQVIALYCFVAAAYPDITY